MPLLRWSNPRARHQTSVFSGERAGCREINLRIWRWEKNVLDIPFYRSGDYTSLRRLFAFFGVNECSGDVTPTLRQNWSDGSSASWFVLQRSTEQGTLRRSRV